MKIYLASRSPRRAELLTQMGVTFTVINGEVNECVLDEEAADAYVLRLCQAKARAGLDYILQEGLSACPILAADTTVCLGATILGKPENAHEAFTMLKQLSGQWHTVHTAVALATNGEISTALSTTQVKMTALSDAQINAYIDTQEPLDKAGSYGIQGLGGALIERIEGSYTGVMGLPIFETMQLLKRSNNEYV